MEMFTKITFLLTVTCLTVDIMAKNTYITDSGRTCIMCPAGHFHKDDCEVPNTIALCKACPAGTFSSTYSRARHCEPCMPHCESDNLVTVQTCTATTNMVCDCPPGMKLENPDDKYHARCKPFKGCEPGSGVLVQGTSEHEPKCAECRPGTTFSPEMSSSEPCYPCTQCPNDDFLQECNTTHDSICNVPKPWYDKFIMGFLILNGSVLMITVMIILIKITKLVLKKGGSPCNAKKKHCGDKEEREALNSVSSELELSKIEKSEWGSIFRFLSSELESDWEDLIRDLFHAIGVGDCDAIIQQIKHDHNTIKERIYQCLLTWQERGSPRSTIILVRVLTKHHMKTVKKLQATFPSEFPSIPGT